MKSPVGSFSWADLTIEHAVEIKNFYTSVIGFSFIEFDMGGYNDYCMNSLYDGQAKAGSCHAKGINKELPPMGQIYFYVADLKTSLEKLKENAGQILLGPKS